MTAEMQKGKYIYYRCSGYSRACDDELTHLLWRQVDFEAGVIHLEDYEITHKGKTIKFELKDGEARDVPIFPALREELLRCRKVRQDAGW